MSDTLDWRDIAHITTRRWWIPVILAVLGALLGVYAATSLAPVHRSQGTVLVGPLDSTVTRSTTLRASESLATFYADMARRELVLVPVRERLGLEMPLEQLRTSVSAAVPDENRRVVVITVESGSEDEARSIASEIVKELVSLSPAPTGATAPEFVGAQVDALEATIQRSEAQIDELQSTLSQTAGEPERAELERTITLRQQLLNEQRQTYVELVALEPDSDAGGLAVLDDVASVTHAGRASPTTGALVGGAAGAVVGLVLVWLLDKRTRARNVEPEAPVEPVAVAPPAPTVNLVVRPTAGAANRRLPRAAPRRTEPRVQPRRERASERVNGTTEEMTTTAERTGRDHSSEAARPATLGLVEALCVALADATVTYCHWKSNEALDRSLSGDNDLDLLVARADQARFLEVLAHLGFKEARLPSSREVPGVSHYYGLDRPSGRLVHVHAHFRLVLGDDTTKNFWLPVEAAYLASSSQDGLLPVPAPEHELAVLVLRMVLKHSTWDAQLQGRGTLSASEKREVEWLLRRTDWERAEAFVATNLPFLVEVWPECRRAIESGCPRFERMRAADRLVRALESCARRPRGKDTALRVTRRVTWRVHRHLARRPVGKRLVGGGAVVAFAGGDGAGKSTAVEATARWLSGPLAVERVHLGRPPKSPATVAVKIALSVGNRAGLFPDLAAPTVPPADPSAGWLLWHVCTARNRRRAYARARRVAAEGGVVVSDRFPLAQLRSMDGPRTQIFRDRPGQGRLARWLIDHEARQYSVFARPDVLVVLRVDPEVAVRRKTDEAPDYVRRRCTEVWEAAWEEQVVVIDAGQPAAAVMADIRAAVWDRL